MLLKKAVESKDKKFKEYDTQLRKDMKKMEDDEEEVDNLLVELDNFAKARKAKENALQNLKQDHANLQNELEIF